MKWKPEYAGVAVLVLFLAMFPITAIRIARRREASVRFRRSLVVLLVSDFLFLILGAFAISSHESSSEWPSAVTWIAVVALGLSVAARRYLQHVSKAEYPEVWGKRRS
jgi:Kef-type K+ transport system membrane component KefB